MTNSLSGSGLGANTLNEVKNGDIEVPQDLQIEQIKEKFEKEKELFRKEMFHRFKNNLQVITSLFSIQSSYVKDEESRRMFINSTERVKAIALIYDRLFQSENPDEIYFDKYLEELVNYIIKNCIMADKIIGHEFHSVKINLPFKTAVSIGLIINEIITNSLNHAFIGLREGKIKINLEHSAGEYLLSVEDNGIGLPEDFNIETNDSLGLMLVRSLTEQLNGSLELLSVNGTKFIIKFPGNLEQNFKG